jgi:hypothetical protein
MPKDCQNIATYVIATEERYKISDNYEEHWKCYCWEHAPSNAQLMKVEWQRLTGGICEFEPIAKLLCGTDLRVEAEGVR